MSYGRKGKTDGLYQPLLGRVLAVWLYAPGSYDDGSQQWSVDLCYARLLPPALQSPDAMPDVWSVL